MEEVGELLDYIGAGLGHVCRVYSFLQAGRGRQLKLHYVGMHWRWSNT